MLDLENPFHSYLFGFLQADGHLYLRKKSDGTFRNGTSLKIELKLIDEEILLKIKENLLPIQSFLSYRKRNTNFKKNYESVTLVIGSADFRNELMLRGLPAGKKSDIIKPPDPPYCACDYWRGIIDGDGSLGISKNNTPFISLNSSSDSLANEYKNYTEIITGNRLKSVRNKRDNTYNLNYINEDAQFLASHFYYPGCVALERKYIIAKQFLTWERKVPKKPAVRSWTVEQDSVLLNNSLEKAMKILDRSEDSIKMRLWRLRGKNVI